MGSGEVGVRVVAQAAVMVTTARVLITSTLHETVSLPLTCARVSVNRRAVAEARFRIGPSGVSRALDFPACVAAFGAYLTSKGRSKDTVARYPALVEEAAAFSRWKTTDDIDPSTIQAWLATATGKTHNNRLAAIRRFWRWARKVEGAMGADPTSAIERAIEAGGDGMAEFTLAEMDRIEAAADGRRRDVYIISKHTGLRKGCVCRGMRCGMYDRARKLLVLPPALMKNRKGLTLPLHPRACDVLDRVCAGLAPDDFVFPFWVDNRTLFKDMEAAGVPRKNERGQPRAWHSWRKGVLSAMAEKGEHPKTMQQVAGHSDPKLALKVYARVGDPTVRAAIDRLYPVVSAHEEKTYPISRQIPAQAIAEPTPHGTILGEVLHAGNEVLYDSPTSRLETARPDGSPVQREELSGTSGARPLRAVTDGASRPTGPSEKATPRGFEPRGTVVHVHIHNEEPRHGHRPLPAGRPTDIGSGGGVGQPRFSPVAGSGTDPGVAERPDGRGDSVQAGHEPLHPAPPPCGTRPHGAGPRLGPEAGDFERAHGDCLGSGLKPTGADCAGFSSTPAGAATPRPGFLSPPTSADASGEALVFPEPAVCAPSPLGCAGGLGTVHIPVSDGAAAGDNPAGVGKTDAYHMAGEGPASTTLDISSAPAACRGGGADCEAAAGIDPGVERTRDANRKTATTAPAAEDRACRLALLQLAAAEADAERAQRQSAENRARLIRLLFPAVLLGAAVACAAWTRNDAPVVEQRPTATDTEVPR